ncbi:MAG: N-6 DNA methylase [Candidatus Thermoplasmatota archaeon]|jgi:type I restriction-modification system DNA methylase subunit|nr:N-6 DNA methylase [Candidatus Thermoplasmatota archaeon]
MDEKALKNKIQELINKYNKVVEEKKIKRYNEEMTKKDFILPLFEILGWNVYNKPNRSDSVSAEEKISKKRVDYGFRINGIPKFFLEAKALKEDLDNPKFIEQAINYAWYKGCTWAVLTDFEQIKIFNAEWKTTHPMHNLLKSITCYEFIDRFDELWLLSKDSFEHGLLDKEAEKWGKKTKKTPVDKQLLYDFTRFREMLSKNITKLNQDKHLTEEELDESVQRILDRLIFIRNCEDRGLEEKKLWEAKNETKVLKKIREIFRYFDENYNSKLFTYDPIDHKKVHLCDTLDIDDDILREIIKSLYQTKDQSLSYDFSAIKADVLGNIYEQYLGHILKKSEKRARITNGKMHRKEQGIYYTPTYIVDYIVQNTLGELLKNKKIDADKIRVLDPACGSGSFLIKAFDVLNDYWKKKDKNYSQARFDITGQGITFTKKKKILQNNIFGVDLDKKAVEIAQLNLLLKIAEKGQSLPLLQQNIKCGNSLIDDPNIVGEKAFKWEDEFKEIMQEGGFDVVIGNPPYVDIKQLDPKIVKYLFSKFNTVENRMNLYSTFVERSLSLLKEGGYFGLIIPNSILYNESYSKIRELLLNTTSLRKIVRLPDNVFENVKVETIILIYQKKRETTKKKNCQVLIYPREESIASISEENCDQIIYFNQKLWNKTDRKIINISVSTLSDKLLSKIEKDATPLIEICDFSLGLTPYDKYKGHTREQIKERVFHSTTKKNETFKPLLSGENIVRYGIFWDGKEYISYGDWLGAPREQRFFLKPRIVVRQIVSGKPPRIYAGYTEEELYNTQSGFNILVKNENVVLTKYILAILNSSLMNFYHKEKYLDPSKTLFQKILIANAKKFPIKVISLDKQRRIALLVNKIISFNKRLNELGDKKTDERAKIEEEIKKTDNEIDQLVYKLYGLTKKEIAIVEESLRN